MNTYQNYIVDILVENVCMTRSALFFHKGIKNKKEFTKDLKQLIAEERIRYEDDIYNKENAVLSPKVLKLVEFEKIHGALTRIFKINYVPTSVLIKVLQYVPACIDPFEDSLNFKLEIEGYQLDEKYKAFFEAENGFTLNFTKFNYTLWAEYLLPKYYDLEPRATHIILMDDNEQSAETFMAKMKTSYTIASNWYHLFNSNNTAIFLENTFLNNTFISLIIFRCRNNDLIKDFLQNMQTIINRYDEMYLNTYIPVLMLTEPDTTLDLSSFNKCPQIGYIYYACNEDEAILGNVIQSQINKHQ
jgi:hypothetical protein